MIDEAGRQRRFEQWEELGLDRVKNDLLHHRGLQVVGGGQEVQDLAWEWVRMKEAELAKAAQKPEELLTLKPSVAPGISINLKELWRRFRARYLKK